VSYNDENFNITLDSGATVSYLRKDKALKLKLSIFPNSQLALLADMKTRMKSLGEVDFLVSVNNIQLRLRALVMENLQAECFGGTTFHADNKCYHRHKGENNLTPWEISYQASQLLCKCSNIPTSFAGKS